MSLELIVTIVVAAVVIVVMAVVWALTSGKARASFREELSLREKEVIRKDAEIATSEALRKSEREQHEKALADLKAAQEKAIEASRTALAMENE